MDQVDKKIIDEEGHSLPQLIHIWQLVVRHPALFYTSSAQFVPQMVNSLDRIGLSPVVRSRTVVWLWSWRR